MIKLSEDMIEIPNIDIIVNCINGDTGEVNEFNLSKILREDMNDIIRKEELN